MAQNDKTCLSHATSQEAYIIWLWFVVHMCKTMTSPDAFVIFSKFWFSKLLGRWKGKKWPKMTTFCLSHTVFHEPCLIWLWVLVHMCKMMISPAIFCILRWGRRVKGQKMIYNYQFQSVTLYLKNCISYHQDCW